MKNSYRINVRFDLRKEHEKKAAEFLISLSENGSQTRNRFIVDAVTEAIRRKSGESDFSLDDIRDMFREELSSVSFIAGKPDELKTVNAELTEKQKAENDASVLSALELFG